LRQNVIGFGLPLGNRVGLARERRMTVISAGSDFFVKIDDRVESLGTGVVYPKERCLDCRSRLCEGGSGGCSQGLSRSKSVVLEKSPVPSIFKPLMISAEAA